MPRFHRSTIRRTCEHLLYVLRTQEELCYVRADGRHSEALVYAAGVDSAWHWPEALIHQAAEELERAGIVQVRVLHKTPDDSQPTYRIAVTAEGRAFLRSGKTFRCHKTSRERLRRAFGRHLTATGNGTVDGNRERRITPSEATPHLSTTVHTCSEAKPKDAIVLTQSISDHCAVGTLSANPSAIDVTPLPEVVYSRQHTNGVV